MRNKGRGRRRRRDSFNLHLHISHDLYNYLLIKIHGYFLFSFRVYCPTVEVSALSLRRRHGAFGEMSRGCCASPVLGASLRLDSDMLSRMLAENASEVADNKTPETASAVEAVACGE